MTKTKGNRRERRQRGHSDQQEGGHSDQQEGRPRETSRMEGGHAVRQQGGHSLKAFRTPNSNLFGEVQKSPGRQMNRNAGKGKRADASSAGTEPGKQK